jgi:uncharacterized protein
MMSTIFRRIVIRLALALFAARGLAAEKAASLRIVIQVSQNDPERMNLALLNTSAAFEYYRDKGENVAVEIVAYGPGLNMLREDTSPVKDRIKQLKASDIGKEVHFSACHNTQMAMQKKEGHPIPIIPEATVVPSGVARLTQREEEGWSDIRP